MTDSPIVVLHDLGAPDAGRGWRQALADAGWEGAVIAPDLPGHGDAPAPTGGSYESGDALLTILPLYRQLDPDGRPPVVVGVGVHGWGAQVLALAGRASALVLVDGLGGPWRNPWDQIAEGRRWVRSILADEAAIAPAPERGLDPRAVHAVPTHGSKRLALKSAAAMPVPVVLLESPASPLRADEVTEIAEAFASGATQCPIDSVRPDVVVAAMVGRLLATSDTPA